MQKIVIKRRVAAQAGKSKYFTGRPCVHGHLVERYVSNGICVSCSNVNMSRYKSGMNLERKAKLLGEKIINERVHPDDYGLIRQFIDALKSERIRKMQEEINRNYEETIARMTVRARP